MVYDAPTFWSYFIHKVTGVPRSTGFAPDDFKSYYVALDAPKVIASDDVHWYIIKGREAIAAAWWPLIFSSGFYCPNTLELTLSKMTPVPGAVLSLQDVVILSMKWIYEKGACVSGRPHPLYFPASNPESISASCPLNVSANVLWALNKQSGLTLADGNIGIANSGLVYSGGSYLSGSTPTTDISYVSGAKPIQTIDLTNKIVRLTPKFRIYFKVQMPSNIGPWQVVDARFYVNPSVYLKFTIGKSDHQQAGSTVWVNVSLTDGSTPVQIWDGFLNKGEYYRGLIEQSADSFTSGVFNVYLYDSSNTLKGSYVGKSYTTSSTLMVRCWVTPVSTPCTATMGWTYFYYNDTDTFPVQNITISDVPSLLVYCDDSGSNICVFSGDPLPRSSVNLTPSVSGGHVVVRKSSVPVAPPYGGNIGSNIAGALSFSGNVNYDGITVTSRPITTDTWSNGTGRALVSPFSGVDGIFVEDKTFWIVTGYSLSVLNQILYTGYDYVVSQSGATITIHKVNEVLNLDWVVSEVTRDVPAEFSTFVTDYLLQVADDFMSLVMSDEDILPLKNDLQMWSQVSYASVTLSQRAMLYTMINMSLSHAANAICQYFKTGTMEDAAGIKTSDLLAMNVKLPDNTFESVSNLYANRLTIVGDPSSDYTQRFIDAYTSVKNIAVRAEKGYSLCLILSSAAGASNSITNTLESIVAMTKRSADSAWQDSMAILNIAGEKEAKRSILMGYYDSIQALDSVQDALNVLADLARGATRGDSAASMLDLAIRVDMDQVYNSKTTGAEINPDSLYIMPHISDQSSLEYDILSRAFCGKGENTVLARTALLEEQFLGDLGLADSLSLNWYLDALTIPFQDSATGDYRYNPSGENPSLSNPTYSWSMRIPASPELAITPDPVSGTEVFGRFLTVPLPYFDILICLKDYLGGTAPSVELGLSVHPRLKGGDDARMVADTVVAIDKFGDFICKIHKIFNPTSVVSYTTPNAQALTDKMDEIKENAALMGVSDLYGDAFMAGAIGACAGAAIGSIVPGPGTAVGAAVGFLVGGAGVVIEDVVVNHGSATDVMKNRAQRCVNSTIDIQNYESWGWMLDSPLIFTVDGDTMTAEESEAFMEHVLANWIINGGVGTIRSVGGVMGCPALPSYTRPSFKFGLKSVYEETADFLAALSATAIVLGTLTLVAISRRRKTERIKTTLNLDVLGLTRYNLFDRGRIKKAAKTYELVDDMLDKLDTEADLLQASLTDTVNSNNSRFTTLDSAVGGVNNAVGALDAAVDGINSDVDSLTSALPTMYDGKFNSIIQSSEVQTQDLIRLLKRPTILQ